jgi:hypothetical protein
VIRAGAWLIVLAAALSCRSSNPAVFNAVLGTAVGLGASAHQRSQGGCYAVCVGDTACNHKTGYCDPLPCRGRCASDESCRETATGPRCVPNEKDRLD